MAAPMESEQNSPVSENVPEFLDPLSPKFDPRRALYDKHTPIPVPDAKQFNNLAEFENYLQGKDAKSFQKKKAKSKEQLPGIIALRAAAQAKEAVRKSAIMAKSAGPSERTKTQERRNRSTTVFTRMSDYKKGPLSVLRKCVEERLRVIVVVRAAVAVRSRCRGYVIGFDKHFNMALMDVDEKYIRPVPLKKKERSQHDKDRTSQESLLAEKTDRLSVEIREPRDGSHDRNIKIRHSDAEKSGDKVLDLREKLKLSKDKKQNLQSDSKVKSRETSSGRSSSRETIHRSSDLKDSLESAKSKDERTGLKETFDQSSRSGSSILESLHSRTQVPSSEDLKKRSRSKEVAESIQHSNETKLDRSEVKRSGDYKDHYRNYMSDSNVYVKRQHQRLQEKSSKSDSENISEASDRQKKSGKELRKHFQPFWPLYKKWTESRCYAEYEIVTRHVNQLFIRGDNVVSVSIADC